MKESEEESIEMPAPKAKPKAKAPKPDPTAHLPVDHAAVSRALSAVGSLSGRASLDAFASELRSSHPAVAQGLGDRLAGAPAPVPSPS